ncbi:MAG TPA: hypothetical protein VGM83_13200 [Devosiaceae bacterium]|jgi:hypothetical protein
MEHLQISDGIAASPVYPMLQAKSGVTDALCRIVHESRSIAITPPATAAP